MNVKYFAKTLEQEAINQVEQLANLSAFKDCKIRIMPDAHAGAGCVVGFTADLGDKVIPNIVGVDIGCGMLTIELGNIEIDFAKLDSVIRRYVPFGFSIHASAHERLKNIEGLHCYPQLTNVHRLRCSLGTLGGGNHFIEIDVDEDGNKYLVIHTGSRNLGKQVADIYQKMAIDLAKGYDSYVEKRNQLIADYKVDGKKQDIQAGLKQLREEYELETINMPKELCYLEGAYRQSYLFDMEICQNFATRNRAAIAKTILSRMGWKEVSRFETIHNYISFEDNIVRKGAISARKDERVLIPLNMRDGCIIGVGKGNEDWNYSAPHGAGRVMSRKQAKKYIDLKDFEETMKNVYSTSVSEDTVDEAPFVYKPSEEIIELVQDTIDIERVIKPIYNFKAS